MRNIISAARTITFLIGLIVIVSCSESNDDKSVILSKRSMSIKSLDAKLIQVTSEQKTELLSLRKELSYIYKRVLDTSPEGIAKARETVKNFTVDKADLNEYLAALDALEKSLAGLKDKWHAAVEGEKVKIRSSNERAKIRISKIKKKLATQKIAKMIKFYEMRLNREEEDLKKAMMSLDTIDNNKNYNFFYKRAMRNVARAAWYKGQKVYNEIIDVRFAELLKTASVFDVENSVALNDNTELFILWAKRRANRGVVETTRTYSINSDGFKQSGLMELDIFQGANVRQNDWLSVFTDFNGLPK